MRISSLKRRFFGDKAFYKMALAVAIPIMIQNGITQFVGLLDNIMVGRVGTEQMTGVAIANQLIFVFNLTIFGAVSGAGIFGAQFYGQGNQDGVRYTFRFKLILGMLLAVLGIGLFLAFDEPLIMLYLKGEGTEEEIAASLGYAKEYLHIMLFSFVPFVVTQCYSGTLREASETVVPMAAGIISVAVNLCLNTVLIFGYLGFDAMGSAGAAIATVIARFVEATVVMIWTHTHTKRNPFAVGLLRSLRIPGELIGSITKKTVPLMLNEMLWAVGMALLGQCYSLHSYDVVSAYNITATVTNVFNVAFMALASAIGIIVGQQLGANKFEEAADTDRKLIVFSTLVTIVIGAVMAAVSGLIPQIYNTTNEIRSLAAELLLVAALCMPINALATACYFTMRSGGKTLITFLFDSLYICCFTVPIAYLLSSFTSISIIPLFLICQLADLGKCVIGLILIKKGMWIQNIVKD